jgi:hypothetical protein
LASVLVSRFAKEKKMKFLDDLIGQGWVSAFPKTDEENYTFGDYISKLSQTFLFIQRASQPRLHQRQ